jgi:hypothetical protein
MVGDYVVIFADQFPNDVTHGLQFFEPSIHRFANPKSGLAASDHFVASGLPSTG